MIWSGLIQKRFVILKDNGKLLIPVLQASGEYKWMAVLTWKGQKPDIDEINEISKKIENYRAKILMFDEWDTNTGYSSGILQVMGGSSKIGERAFFSRNQVGK